METKRETYRDLYEWVGALVWAVTAVVLVFTFAVRGQGVSGGSMRNTLQDGDQMLVVNRWLCGPCRPGDIVIFSRADFDDGKPIVKRVIATAGQTVDIDFDTGVVFVDGEALDEPYTREPTWREEELRFPLTVPEGCLFVMGDNRNGSTDSRSTALGPVDTRSVIGKAVAVVLPGKTAETEKRDWTRIGILNKT